MAKLPAKNAHNAKSDVDCTYSDIPLTESLWASGVQYTSKVAAQEKLML